MLVCARLCDSIGFFLEEFRHTVVLHFLRLCVFRWGTFGSQEESVLDGGRQLSFSVIEGISWTAARWWGGGLNRVRCAVLNEI